MPTGWAIVIVVQWLAIAALTIVVLGVLRQMASLLERAAAGPVMRIQLPAAEVGTRLPTFASVGDGSVTEPATLLGGRPAVMLFLSAGCAPCLSLAAEIASSDLPGELGRSLIAVTARKRERRTTARRGARPRRGGRRMRPGPRHTREALRDGGERGWGDHGEDAVNTLAQVTDMATSAWSL